MMKELAGKTPPPLKVRSEQRPGQGIRRLFPRSSALPSPGVRHSFTSSRNDLSLPEREGWRSLRRALASI